MIAPVSAVGHLLIAAILVGSCNGEVGTADSAHPVDRRTGLATPSAPPKTDKSAPTSEASPPKRGAFPGAATTGITEQWCPRWNELKTTSQSVTLTGAAPVLEYQQINGQLVIKTNDATVRCVRITTPADPFLCHDEGGCAAGALIEDTHAEETVSGTAGFNVWTPGFSGRRLKSHPTGCDGITFQGGLLRDSYIDTKNDPKCTSEDPHADAIQASMSKGPIWILNTAFIGDRESSSSGFFTTDFGPILDVTVDGSYFAGGAATVRFSNKSNYGPPDQVRFINNTIEKDSWFYYPCDWTSDGAEGSGQCVEYENNVLDTGGPIPGARPPHHEKAGGCSGVSPVPTWAIERFELSSASCPQDQPACDHVDLGASASGSQKAGSPRWRFNCGGSASNMGGLHPRGADLWYDYPACNGQQTCDMVGACDYTVEPAGTYTVRMYSESGPGSGIRVSDSASATVAWTLLPKPIAPPAPPPRPPTFFERLESFAKRLFGA